MFKSGPYSLFYMDFNKISSLRRYTILLGIGLLMFGCGEDVPTQPTETITHLIESVQVSPQNITFDQDLGVKDSTIVMNIAGTYKLAGSSTDAPVTFRYEITRNSDAASIRSGEFEMNTSNSTFSTSFNLETNTTDFNDYLIFIFGTREDLVVSNTAQSTVKIRGFTAGLPEILAVNNPDTVLIPSSGTNPFALMAKATHPNGQSLIDRVLVDIRDQNDNLLAGSPFTLFDDGGAGNSNSGDAIAADSIYTRAFNIGSSNNPDVYQLFYHAIDNLGASSDTVQSQMVIKR